MGYIDKNGWILKFFGSNNINKGVFMIQPKFGIISKAGLPEFLSKYTKNGVKFKFKREIF